MARPAGLPANMRKWGAIRTINAAPAADPAPPFTDLNYPVSRIQSASRFESIFIGYEIDGAAPGILLEFSLLFRDEDAPDGSRWVQALVGEVRGVADLGAAQVQQTPALAPGQFAELFTFGWDFYPRIVSVANVGAASALRILARGGRRIDPYIE